MLRLGRSAPDPDDAQRAQFIEGWALRFVGETVRHKLLDPCCRGTTMTTVLATNATSRFASRLRQVARLVALVVGAIGSTMLLAWTVRPDVLRPFFLRGTVMNPMSAAGDMLLSAALWLLASEKVGPYRRMLARIFASTALAFGALLFVEHFLGRDLGIHLLFLHPSSVPTRPALVSGTELLLLGLALLLLDAPAYRGLHPAELLSLTAGLVALAALTSHAYGALPYVRALDTLTMGITLSSALSFGLLSLGTFCARPERGLMSIVTSDAPGGVMARRLVPAALVVGPSLGLLLLIGRAAGLFGPRVGFAVFATATALIGIALILLTAARLNRIEAARMKIEQAAQRANAAERRLHAQFEAVSRASWALSDIVAATPLANEATLLQAVVDHARLIADAEMAAIGMGGDAQRSFEQFAFSGITQEQAHAIGRIPRPVGLLGAVVQEKRAIRLRDASSDPRALGVPPHHPPVRSFLGVPVRYHGTVVGNLYLANKRSAPEFTEDDQHAIELLADRAGTALETMRLYAREALERSRLQAVLDSMTEGVVVLDETGRIVSINRSALALANEDGARRDPFGNSVTFEAYRPAGEPLPWEDFPYVRAIRRGESVVGVELRIRARDGRMVPVLASATPVRGPDGKLQGTVAVFEDISSLKDLERLREEWTAVVAHDLRQPIGVITLSAQALARAHKGEMSESEAKAIERIRAGAKRLDAMIEDLLDASRIEAHRLKIEKREVNLKDLVCEIVERAGALTRGHSVHVEVQGKIPTIMADPNRIEQVLMNLLSNAGKYGDPGTEIRVVLAQRDGEVEIAVSNRGKDLTPEDLSKLFTRFYRTQRAQTSTTQGLGLGLYITKGLVEAHGGRIWAESASGITTFRFTLPAHAPVPPRTEGLPSGSPSNSQRA